jgi:glycerate kinase
VPKPVLDIVGLDPRSSRAAFTDRLVVTGQDAVDATTLQGKAPAAVVWRARAAGVACVVFGGRVAAAVLARKRSF